MKGVLRLSCLVALCACAATAADKQILMIAGRPSHGPGAHEHNAGVRLLAKWIGLDYGRTWGTDTYRLLLAETVALAIELGVERLWLGATALETKRQFGVTVEERLTAIVLPGPLRWLVDATGVASTPFR